MTTFRIKENSFVAKLAAAKLKAQGVAIVFGHTIHLHGTSREDFLRNKRWLRHELCHVRQYEQEGYFGFLIKYVWEWMRKGYDQISFEVEARAAEGTPVDEEIN